MVKIYSKPNCPSCTATYKFLEKLGVNYTSFDIEKDEDARERAFSTGLKQLPIIEHGNKVWSGFNPTMLESLSA